jgi:hypothetical protein
MNIAHCHDALRRQHFAELKPHHWRAWHDGSAGQFVASRLRDAGYAAKPVRFVDWPGGWFVELDTGLVVFVAVRFRDQGHCAIYPDLPIVELRQPEQVPPTVAEVIGGGAVALLCGLVIPFLSLFFA